jgi:hypothetical protein
MRVGICQPPGTQGGPWRGGGGGGVGGAAKAKETKFLHLANTTTTRASSARHSASASSAGGHKYILNATLSQVRRDNNNHNNIVAHPSSCKKNMCILVYRSCFFIHIDWFHIDRPICKWNSMSMKYQGGGINAGANVFQPSALSLICCCASGSHNLVCKLTNVKLYMIKYTSLYMTHIYGGWPFVLHTIIHKLAACGNSNKLEQALFAYWRVYHSCVPATNKCAQ